MVKYERQWPVYKTQWHGIKAKGQGGHRHELDTPENSIMWIVSHYQDAKTQLRVLEMIRWFPYNIQARINIHLKDACELNGADENAVLLIIYKCLNHKSEKTITRKEITEITGFPAMPIMKAVSIIMEFPYSLRGLTPDRRVQKEFGLRGKPVYKR